MPETRLTDDINLAARILREGGTVAFPTETVYGLGADATNAQAIDRIFAAKGRPSDNPLIVHVADLPYVTHVASKLSLAAKLLLDTFSPGPITTIVEKASSLPPSVTGGLPSVGVRIPDHPIALRLLELASIPVAAPSANLSGKPSGTTWQRVEEDLSGKIDVILKGPSATVGVESTVVDCYSEDNRVRILRLGGISGDAMRQILSPHGIEVLDPAEPNTFAPSTQVLSPGSKHPHYQPKASVVLFEPHELSTRAAELDSSARTAIIWMNASEAAIDDLNANLVINRFVPSLEEYARDFYEFLRASDDAQAELIICELAAEQGIGCALRDRQIRAAGKT